MSVTMKENFGALKSRTMYSLDNTDLKEVGEILGNIEGATLVVGSGGSAVVAKFLAKVLSAKNGIIAEYTELRDLKYRDLKNYKNIVTCSYSGKSYGVEVAFNNSLNHYLLTAGKIDKGTSIKYEINEKERSFISLSATLIPLSIVLAYYLGNITPIKEIISKERRFGAEPSSVYEIFSGYESATAARFLDSTMTESGIAIPLIHDKYDFCHGRSTTGYVTIKKHGMILFDSDTELDKLLLEELKEYYSEVIRLRKMFEDTIVNDFYLTYSCMYLCRHLALQKGMDLSQVNHSPAVKKFYRFGGEI